MIKETLYKKTVDILFNAYFNDTLEHGHQCACAVGNLVAANNNCYVRFTGRTENTRKGELRFFEIVDKNGDPTTLGEWFYVGYNNQIRNIKHIDGLLEIESTGYTLYEILKIEFAFENADKGKSREEWMFNGLEAVLNALKEIHEVEDDSEIQRFKKLYQTKI